MGKDEGLGGASGGALKAPHWTTITLNRRSLSGGGQAEPGRSSGNTCSTRGMPGSRMDPAASVVPSLACNRPAQGFRHRESQERGSDGGWAPPVREAGGHCREACKAPSSSAGWPRRGCEGSDSVLDRLCLPPARS
ncbi:hypothetical protein Micbo1qcDRAFT_1276 [Microdochium bolleyi]|uniref:Uncharacterized protein n=1 Tax=Microdochium bolleyi TaxID=196109 RepID=A0A136JHB1_9PEZI|nr:hypothetical protein Micbo1qcDRAFT_1276 [Microdochium bolleyi]